MNHCLMNMLDQVTTRCGISLRRACGIMGVSRTNHIRWKKRTAHKVPLVNAPGPRKMVVADIEAITRDIASLPHSLRRSCGTAALYKRYSGGISRRGLQALGRGWGVRAVG